MLATTDTQLRDVTRTVEQDGPGFAVILGPASTGCGWDGALLGLARHLKQTATCDLWQEAHLATGADPHQAHEAAASTAAFYRGEDPNGGDAA